MFGAASSKKDLRLYTSAKKIDQKPHVQPYDAKCPIPPFYE